MFLWKTTGKCVFNRQIVLIGILNEYVRKVSTVGVCGQSTTLTRKLGGLRILFEFELKSVIKFFKL